MDFSYFGLFYITNFKLTVLDIQIDLCEWIGLTERSQGKLLFYFLKSDVDFLPFWSFLHFKLYIQVFSMKILLCSLVFCVSPVAYNRLCISTNLHYISSRVRYQKTYQKFENRSKLVTLPIVPNRRLSSF